MSVYFHANFNLDRERMSSILMDLIENPELNNLQIANKFGYKAPFTIRYKSWLKKCGIIKNSNRVSLTEYGNVIYEKDSKMSKEPTLWYMHSFLTSSEENAEAWNFFYNSYLPKNKNFTKPQLSDAISMKLMAHDPGHFGQNAHMIKVITKVMIDSYISDMAFGSLGIIAENKGIYERGNIKNPYTWKDAQSFTKLY